MPLQTVCQKFFSASLRGIHSFRINVLISMAIALCNGADLTLTSLGRSLPGRAHVKNKIKRVDRALGNTAIHHELPLIQQMLTRSITSLMPFCVIAVDWSGWHDKNWHLLRASLVCNGRSLPLMSEVVPAWLAQNSQVQCAFLDRLHAAIPDGKPVTIITDAGFRTDWFRHISQLGWCFTGRVRGLVCFQLEGSTRWMKISDLQAESTPIKVGYGVLARKPRMPCYGSFYLQKRPSAGRHGKGRRSKTEKEHRSSAQEPWLLFSNVEGLEPHQIMTLYSRRMQIEQNFRDEKSPRFGYGLRLSRSQGWGRLAVLSVVAAMASLVMWLTGYMAEKKQLHRHYQANSEKGRRILSYLRLAGEVLRDRAGIVRRMNIVNMLKKLGNEYSNMVMGC
ncbi:MULTISPECIES: IS4 family transposase [unclassified Serratia (in: enterobacteria)]|uniref:IS4 family transposase n=1 Tax=unclassified Serratia (in: enterobacteria) TaxID=2647522 RepID=UPI0007430E02|nr:MULTISPECIES: IS4 family transposase [unclassified Serratia (in: enterobacteria)]ALX92437.1 transposase [Serratia fonticola]ALX93242.1 transposase [Serratia fonticola]ALX94429.1 transposase [Serratia fonticola]UAN49817.1 IS4 family transposase [Serratia sp. JSRIV002]UAN61463.1 IS4 family transposase [Serratia sp. JSRIV006]